MARKKKIITVRGSTTKKQAQKRKGVSLAQSLTVNVITGKRKSSGKVGVKAPSKPPIIFSPVINLGKSENAYTDYIKTPTATYSIDKAIPHEVVKPLSERRHPADASIIIDTSRPSSDYFFNSVIAPPITRKIPVPVPTRVPSALSTTIKATLPLVEATLPLVEATLPLVIPKFQFEAPEYFMFAPSKQLTEPATKSSLPFNTPSSYWSSLPTGFSNPTIASLPTTAEQEQITRPAKTEKMSDSYYFGESQLATPESYQYEPVSSEAIPLTKGSVALTKGSVAYPTRAEQKANKSSATMPRVPEDSRPTPAFQYPAFEEPDQEANMKTSINPAEPEYVSSGLPAQLAPSIITPQLPFELSDFEFTSPPEGIISRKSGTKHLIMPIESVEQPAPAYTDVITKYDRRTDIGMPPSSREKKRGKPVEGSLVVIPPESISWLTPISTPVPLPPSSRIGTQIIPVLAKLRPMPIFEREEKTYRPPPSRPTVPILNVDGTVIVGDMNVKKGKGRPVKLIVNPSEAEFKRAEKAQKAREKYHQHTPQERAQIALARNIKRTETSQNRTAERNVKESKSNLPFEEPNQPK